MIGLIERVNSWNKLPQYTKTQLANSLIRVNTCNTCDNKKYNEMADYFYCGGCQCPLKSKLFAPFASDCPDGLWNI
jgi:hypothetical protein